MTTIPPGWVDLKRAAQDAAGCPPPRRRSGRSREKGRVRGAALDARGRLLLDITSSQPERARGAAAGAHAVSAEICDRCGGPGDPVRLASTWTRTTRCEYCRGAADEVLPRPPWRRHRDVAREIPDPTANDHSHRSMPVIERILTDQKGLSRAVLNFASGSSPFPLRGRPCYATSATKQSGGSSASNAQTKCRRSR